MNILEAIVQARGGDSVRQLGSQFGLGQDQTTSALEALVPALAAGFQRNLRSEDGLQSLAAALANGRHERYVDNPASLNDPQTTADGNGILGHVFGSKETSRQVARHAAAKAGVSEDVLKKLLPLAAALMMGTFAKQSAGAGAGHAGLSGSGGGIAGMLTPLLDRNRDGSVADDVVGMVGRFLGGRS